MADPFSIDVGLDVAGHPALKDSSVSLDVVASALARRSDLVKP